MTRPLRTLHVDIEGGWGGSSRSLFELVRRLRAFGLAPSVIHRQRGPICQWYQDIGIPVQQEPRIPSYVPRETKAAKNLLMSLPRLAGLLSCSRRIEQIAAKEQIDLIHLNYEGLFLLGSVLKQRLSLPIIAHSRTLIPNHSLGRWLARGLQDCADHLLFISPDEMRRYEVAVGEPVDPSRAEVMFNIARQSKERRPYGDPPEVVYLGSIDHTKGTDLLIDVACCLRDMRAPSVRIAIYGKARTDAAFYRYLVQRIENEQLADRIVLCGYANDPMSVMAGALALIRPSRDHAPWGRDVIEATAAGLPVIAAGSTEYVVKEGVTGFLLEPFQPAAAAQIICDLLSDRERWRMMSTQAVAHAALRFEGTAQAQRFAEIVRQRVWRSQQVTSA